MEFLAEQYCDDVLNGRILACKWIILACQRHRDDLRDGHKRGLHFDERSAKFAVAFFPSLCRHWKGEWAGRPFELQPWQQFITWMLFGWKRANGTRRFRILYLEVGRKNGKTTWMAGIGLLLMVADNEPGAEVYSAATKRDQARVVFEDAKMMVKQSPKLLQLIKVFKDSLYSQRSASKMVPLAADAKSLDALNSHANLIDEVHAHKTRDLWDKLETGTGSRRQPLTIGITTAGTDRNTICHDLHIYTQQVVNGAVPDDSFLGFIYTLDKGDDWTDEFVWIKGNPGLGAAKKWDTMREKAVKAKAMPAAQNAFMRLEVNIWTQSVTRWINRTKWDVCGEDEITEEMLLGRICYGGLDLSSTTDVTAFVLVFPPLEPHPLHKLWDKKTPVKERESFLAAILEGTVALPELTADHKYIVLPRFFVPGDNVAQRVRSDNVPYNIWSEQGYIKLTPGNVVDYNFVLAQINSDSKKFALQETAFDRWGAVSIVNNMQELELKTVQFGQGFASMNAPMNQLQRIYLSGQILHSGNPVLTWMADNLVVRKDPAGNIKPDKDKSIEKIDGMVALVMALDRADRHKPQSSVYEGRGIRMFG